MEAGVLLKQSSYNGTFLHYRSRPGGSGHPRTNKDNRQLSKPTYSYSNWWHQPIPYIRCQLGWWPTGEYSVSSLGSRADRRKTSRCWRWVHRPRRGGSWVHARTRLDPQRAPTRTVQAGLGGGSGGRLDSAGETRSWAGWALALRRRRETRSALLPLGNRQARSSTWTLIKCRPYRKMFHSQKLHYKLKNTPAYFKCKPCLAIYMIIWFLIMNLSSHFKLDNSFSSDSKITKRNTTQKYVLRLEFSNWHLLYVGKMLGKKLR